MTDRHSTATLERPRQMSMRDRAGEIVADDPRGRPAMESLLRVLGALTLLVVGAVHLEQYFAVHISNVPTIGPLFVLNFAGATALALLLLAPTDRMFGGGGRVIAALAALGGIGLSVVAFVFLFVSEHTTLFGFHEHGYRGAIYVSLAAEAATAVLLGGYLVMRMRRR